MNDDARTAKSRTRAIWLRVLIYPLALALIPIVFLYYRQHSMIYHPRAYSAELLRSIPPNLAQLRYTTTGAGKQLAFYVPPKSGERTPARVWIVFSGNASLALGWLHFVERNPNASDAFLLVDYPGYGSSAGTASIITTRESSEKAIATLAQQLGIAEEEIQGRICVLGHSLGAAAALDLAVRYPIQRAVLVAPFTTLREEAALVVGRPFSYLLIENYDNRSRLRELAARAQPPRIAIFHGADDTLIPPTMGEALAAATPQMIEFFRVERATHDSIVDDATTAIIAWMNKR